MARVFRLGDFFGITASQLVFFKPKKFQDLLECKYTAQTNECLYSMTKELEYLKSSLSVDSYRPKYEDLIEDFKLFGYFGLTPSDNDNKAKMKISKFYSDSQELSLEDLTIKYGDETERILQMVKDTLTIDVAKAFPNISSNAIKVIGIIYDNMDYLNKVLTDCKKAYEDSQVSETYIAGKPIRDIIKLDENNASSNLSCCHFVNQLYNNLSVARNERERNLAIAELDRNIKKIQSEYEAHDIVFTDVDTIKGVLSEVYSEMTVARFNELIGAEIEEEEIDSIFRELDSYRIGGLGFNSKEMGKETLTSISHEDTTGWSVRSKEHNQKLDALLRIAYIDLKSKKYMNNL